MQTNAWLYDDTTENSRMSETVKKAVAKILAYWASPVLHELGEAIQFSAIKAYVLQYVPPRGWRLLYDNLKILPECAHIRTRIGDGPILQLLWELIDRRPRLGILSPKLAPAQKYRSRATRPA